TPRGIRGARGAGAPRVGGRPPPRGPRGLGRGPAPLPRGRGGAQGGPGFRRAPRGPARARRERRAGGGGERGRGEWVRAGGRAGEKRGRSAMTNADRWPARNTIVAERVVLREVRAAEAADIVAGRMPPDQTWPAGYPLEGTLDAARMLVRVVDAGGYRAGFGMYHIPAPASGTVPRAIR